MEIIKERNWKIDVGEINFNGGSTNEHHELYEGYVFVSVNEERVSMNCFAMI
jgi:hypothetical protein